MMRRRCCSALSGVLNCFTVFSPAGSWISISYMPESLLKRVFDAVGFFRLAGSGSGAGSSSGAGISFFSLSRVRGS